MTTELEEPFVSVPDEDEMEMIEIWLNGDWPAEIELSDDSMAR